jgi:hypothetical protein
MLSQPFLPKDATDCMIMDEICGTAPLLLNMEGPKSLTV